MIVLIHGGFWKHKYSIDNSAIDTLPQFLVAKGYIVYVIEYRRVLTVDQLDDKGDTNNGGWPNTNNDIISALQLLPELCGKLQVVST